MSNAEATRPPALTVAPAPNTTPLGLTSTTWPLADSLPSICEASPAVTRFSAMAEASGCRKVTAACLPMSKPCQSRIALGLVWVMVMALPASAMDAWPAVTRPPVGRALGAGLPAMAEMPAAAETSAVPASIALRNVQHDGPSTALAAHQRCRPTGNEMNGRLWRVERPRDRSALSQESGASARRLRGNFVLILDGMTTVPCSVALSLKSAL